MELELLQMLPGGGSVAALIITVILFLRQQEKGQSNLSSITQSFSERVAASQKLFQDQINNLSSQTHDHQRLYQDQIQGLIDNHLEVSRETIIAIKALESAVRELQGRVGVIRPLKQ